MDRELCNHQIPHVVRNELLDAHGYQPVRRIQSGLSGARVWECFNSANVSACLRAWPTSSPTRERLAELHRQMQLLTDGNINFTPEVHYSKSGSSFISDGQRLWELTTWLPGQANYLESPSARKLAHCMQALAQIHCIWSQSGRVTLGVFNRVGSPTITDRLSRLNAWHHRLDEQSLIAAKARNGVESQSITDTFELLHNSCVPLMRILTEIAEQPVACHFVLRDIWSEHVLFSGDQVTGIIDFGASRYDEPTTDLVRLLGSLEPANEDRRREGFDMYNRCRRALAGQSASASIAFEELSWERFAILHRTATLLSAAQWMDWLIVEDRQFVRPREELLERWRHFLLAAGD